MPENRPYKHESAEQFIRRQRKQEQGLVDNMTGGRPGLVPISTDMRPPRQGPGLVGSLQPSPSHIEREQYRTPAGWREGQGRPGLPPVSELEQYGPTPYGRRLPRWQPGGRHRSE